MGMQLEQSWDSHLTVEKQLQVEVTQLQTEYVNKSIKFKEVEQMKDSAEKVYDQLEVIYNKSDNFCVCCSLSFSLLIIS